MTGRDMIPAVPPMLGEALAFPGVYLEPPAGLPAPARAPRVRRPGRIRRRMATLAAAVVAAGLAGCGSAPAASAASGCHAPSAPNGTTISVDQQGDGSSPYTGSGVGFRCAGGTWVRISAPAPAPLRPVWDGRGTYPDDGIEPLCPAADAGHHAVAGSGADRFAVACARDGSEYAWGVAK